MEEKTVTITQEEYKSLLESKFYIQHAARVLENSAKQDSDLMYIREIKEMLGIEE